ncbi:MAG: hypothetical protein HUU41_21175 [Bryobacteraceae bacterium]|nr:hypothetical protein [Bryobacteraceae bacterium]
MAARRNCTASGSALVSLAASRKMRSEAGADGTVFALHVNEDERPAIVGHLRRGDGGIL